MRTQYNRLYPCSMCKIEAECALNNWCLYDHRNKKCPNYKQGVKDYKKFLKNYLRGRYE